MCENELKDNFVELNPCGSVSHKLVSIQAPAYLASCWNFPQSNFNSTDWMDTAAGCPQGRARVLSVRDFTSVYMQPVPVVQVSEFNMPPQVHAHGELHFFVLTRFVACR